MPDRIYIVHYKRGRLTVTVGEFSINRNGEREAVAQAAWFRLMGQNSLGKDIDKNLATRHILMDELKSRYLNNRHEVYETFKAAIKITWHKVA